MPHTEELDTIGGELTVEAWVKPDAIILSRGYSSIVSKQLNGTGYMFATNLLGPAPGFKAEVAGIQVNRRLSRVLMLGSMSRQCGMVS